MKNATTPGSRENSEPHKQRSPGDWEGFGAAVALARIIVDLVRIIVG